jgi:hypothetical protein
MFGELQFTNIHMRTEIWGPKKRRIPEKRITKRLIKLLQNLL